MPTSSLADRCACLHGNSGHPGFRTALVFLLLLLPLQAQSDGFSWCGVQDVFHYSTSEAAAAACRNHEEGYCITRPYTGGKLARSRAEDGHLYYTAKNFMCGAQYNARYWHFHFGECPDGTADDEGRCAEDPGPGEEEVIEARNAGDPSTCNGGGGAPPSMAAGNPIHIGTGNKYEREVDIAGWSPFADPLVRHYNSRRTNAPGPTWRHTWQRRLAVDGFEYYGDDGDLRTQDDTLALVRPDGRTLIFYRTGERELAEHAADTPDEIVAVGTDQYPLHWTGDAWRYRTEGGVREYYDEEGRLLRIVGRNGYSQRIAYDPLDRVNVVKDDFGRSLIFGYDGAGRLARVTDPAGEVYQYAYDGQGRLTSVTDPGGSSRTYHYGEFGAPADYLTGITDANGNRFATWKYDDRGRAVLSEHAGGADRVELEYIDDERVRVTKAGGDEHTYDLTTIQGRRLAGAIEGGSCSSCSQGAEYEYDYRGLVTREVDRNGHVTTYTYNEAGLQTSRTEAVGTADERTVTTEWDTVLRRPVRITEPGLVTGYGYDGHGRPVSRTRTDTVTGESRTTTWTYQPDRNGRPGRLASVDGPRIDVADVTRFAYDQEGNRSRVTNALGHVTEILAHDAYGRPLTVVDPNGLRTTLAYDADGRLVKRDVGGRVTGFRYDAAGNLTRVASPDGSFLAYEYDAAHRLTALEDENGRRVEYTLDAAGNRTRRNVSDASGAVVREHRQVFDELGRLIQSIGARGQTTHHEYDAVGNRTRTTDPNGATTRRAFDALDRVIRQTDALGGVTAFRYDDRDRIRSVTDPNGHTTRYTYNGFGDRTRVDSPDAGVTTYEYDAAGNVIAKTDARGSTTRYTRDALGRRTEAHYADGTRTTFQWDTAANGIGRLARIREPSGITAWDYNAHGEVTERRQIADGVTLTTTHQYDAAGRRTAMVYPSGTRVTWTHAADEITGISVEGEPILEGIEYGPFGPVAGWTWGDGDVHGRAFDRNGRLVAHGMPEGPRTLAYGTDGQITGITGPNVARSYTYDALDRLTGAAGGDAHHAFGYDANGNRLSRTVDGATERYTYAAGSNRLRAVAGAREATYRHDAAGHRTADGEHSYTWGARGRLRAVDGGDTAEYRYNALGQRVYKRAVGDPPGRARQPAAKAGGQRGQGAGQRPPATRKGGPRLEARFVYDGNGRLIGRYRANGRPLREYIRFGTRPVATIGKNGRIHYVHTDHLGTPRAVSAAGGGVVWRWVSGPFGDTAPDERAGGPGRAFTFNLRFPGQYFDAETRKNYNYFRYYDPRIGRYTAKDPILFQGGSTNFYAYVVNDPVNAIDPLGLADLAAAEVSLGAQIGFSGRVGSFGVSGVVNAGSINQSTAKPGARTVQRFGGGASALGVGLTASTSRTAEQPNESLSDQSFSDTQYGISLPARLPGASAGMSVRNHDFVVSLGAQFVAGLKLQFNVSEALRRLSGGRHGQPGVCR